MLTEAEKNALFHFTSVLNDKILKGLANSVTNGRIQSKTREEAVNCLLLHSESLFTVMNNRKLSSTILLNYLHQFKIQVPGTASREVLMQRIFDTWKLQFSLQPQHFSSNMVLNSNVSNGMPDMGFHQQAQISYNSFDSQQNIQSPYLPNTRSVPSLQYSGQSKMDELMIQADPMPPSNAMQPFNPQKPNSSSYSQAITSYQLLKEVNMLAFDEFVVNFAKMFYELFNANDTGALMHGLNKSHFFEECKVVIMIKGGEEDIETIGENVLDVLNLLSELKRQHQLTCSPNLTPEGVRGKTDSHGLIYAVASGTLHRGRGQLVGVFEQSFILRKDPFEQNSCKIAESTLILRSSQAVDSFSQLLLPSSKTASERNLAIGSAPSQSAALQIMYHDR